MWQDRVVPDLIPTHYGDPTGTFQMVSASAVVVYVTEEVRRQGHNVCAPDGWRRVGYMLNAWSYAWENRTSRPDRLDAVRLGQLVEPIKNAKGLRECGVRVGDRVCPPAARVPVLLDLLFEQRDALSPLEFYKEYELIHPFVDGNGRSGKCLLAWLASSLDNPFFPPADLFGPSIQNP